MAQVLIVEDDPRIRPLLMRSLDERGHAVTSAATGMQGLAMAVDNRPDLVILDLGLPDIDGLEVCRRAREAGFEGAIMIVTARAGELDRVVGLDYGADDYMSKPFGLAELQARVRALLRRATRSDSGPANPTFGDIEVVPDAGTVRVGGADVSLTKTEFKLLCELAQNPGRLLSREVLLERVWGYGYFGDGRLVDVHVRRLRTKVEVDPANPRHVVTVRGLGYRLQP